MDEQQLIQEIIARYQSQLGRPPDDRELASEIENAGKYGLNQLDFNLHERANNYTSDRPFDSSNPPSWYEQSGGGGGGYGGGGGGGGWNVPGFQPFQPPDIDFPTWNAPEWDVPDFVAPTPTTGTFTAPTPTTGGFEAPSWDVGAAPEIAPFEYDSFVGPTADTFTADSGYEFALNESMRALQNAAASQGILRTGGTVKGLMDYARSAASQEFGNVWNRAAQSYLMNRDTALAGYDRNTANTFGTWDRNLAGEQAEFTNALAAWNAGQLYDQNTYNQALQTWQAGQQFDQGNFNNALQTWQTQFNTGQAQNQTALQNYLTEYGASLDKWNQAYQTWQGNNAGALGWFGANLNQQNSQWSNLLNLYKLATANLPTYTPPNWDF